MGPTDAPGPRQGVFAVTPLSEHVGLMAVPTAMPTGVIGDVERRGSRRRIGPAAP
jgi:hypothetical protein